MNFNILGWLFKGQSRKSLKAENTKLKEDLRIHLTDERIPLTQMERILIKGALEFPKFRAYIEEPKTKALYRIVYRKLRDKIRRSIKL